MKDQPPTSPTFNPWDAADRLGITVVRVPLRNARGYTDGHSTIWVHDGLTQCEERVAVCHELVHATQGHAGKQPPDVEDLARKITARWLVPWSHIVDAWNSPDGFRRVAESLCVTVDVVQDRIAYATCDELHSVAVNSERASFAA